MKLTSLTFNNYRSFGPRDSLITISDLTAFIGHNSSGKTTILDAIQKLFGNKRILKSDFHVPLSINVDDINENSFHIEARFEFFNVEGSDLTDDELGIADYFENFTVDNPGGNPYLIIRLDATYEKGSTPEGIIDFNYNYVVGEGEDKLKPINAHDRAKIQVLYVPAVRNPSNQLKNASGTILWRILQQINWRESDKENIKEKIELVDEEVSKHPGVTKLRDLVSTQWRTYHKDERFDNAKIKFGSNDLENILKKLEVEFTPSHTEKAFNVEDLGDGLKSLFYLTLIDSLLELENAAIKEVIDKVREDERILNITPPALTLILVEEPENHVSPHLLGKVVDNLNKLRSRSNSQVLITSHSPSIVKRVEPSKIRHLRIREGNTVVKEIILPNKQDEAYKFVKEAVKAYPELYFSSFVVLGEGDSEEILLNKFLELKVNNLDSVGLSVVPLGGRHVNHFWRLLNQLDIPYLTLLDLDKERDGGGWGRIKYVLKQLIQIGVNRDVILKTKNGVLTEIQLEKLHEWSLKNEDIINSWITMLQRYNVFFSAPLDVDFLMIENFLEYYLMTLEENEGPLIKLNDSEAQKRIQKLTLDEKKTSAYIERVKNELSKALKKNGSGGDSYSEDQKELMIWYCYFFLTRGKPVTHLQALNFIEDEVLLVNAPEVFIELAERVSSVMNEKKG